jgi:hypothetical protein
MVRSQGQQRSWQYAARREAKESGGAMARFKTSKSDSSLLVFHLILCAFYPSAIDMCNVSVVRSQKYQGEKAALCGAHQDEDNEYHHQEAT